MRSREPDGATRELGRDRIPGRGPVQTSAKMMMSPAVAMAMAPGASVPVRYDSTNPSDCILETN